MMKKLSGFVLCIMCFQLINAQTITPLTQLIPKPISIKEASGVFTFYKNTTIENAPALLNAKKLLQSQLINYNFSSTKSSSKIIFIQANAKDPITKEGYSINITPNTISITAKNIQAALLATNTLV